MVHEYSINVMGHEYDVMSWIFMTWRHDWVFMWHEYSSVTSCAWIFISDVMWHEYSSATSCGMNIHHVSWIFVMWHEYSSCDVKWHEYSSCDVTWWILMLDVTHEYSSCDVMVLEYSSYVMNIPDMMSRHEYSWPMTTWLNIPDPWRQIMNIHEWHHLAWVFIMWRHASLIFIMWRVMDIHHLTSYVMNIHHLT